MSIHDTETGDHQVSAADLEELEQNFCKADDMSEVVTEIEKEGGVTRDHIAALESIVPGLIMDNYPGGGFSSKPTKQWVGFVTGAVDGWKVQKGVDDPSKRIKKENT